jgi:HEAT repeat protein
VRNIVLAMTACAAASAILLQPLMAAIPAPKTGDQAYSLLYGALEARNPDTRKEAVRALSLIGGSEPFAARLESMMADKDVPVRLATIEALTELKTSHAVELLRKALTDGVPEVRFAAAKALFTLNDPAGRQALISILNGQAKTSSGLVAEHARESRRMLATPKTLLTVAVHGASFAPVPGIGAAAYAISKIVHDSAVSGPAVAALLLGKDGDPAVVAALREALSAKNASVRAAALRAIATQNDAALETDVIPLLGDRNQAVRLQAAACYLKLERLNAEQSYRESVTD